MSPEIIEKMRDIGAVADMQPAWLERDGGTLRAQFGDARMRFFHPYKSLADAGVVVGGGSDHMQKIGSMRAINPYNPWYGMWVTLTRQPRWTEKPLHTEERISRQQAIRLYTINNAFLLFGEKEKGSLEVGKLADFIVIDRDILSLRRKGKTVGRDISQDFVTSAAVIHSGLCVARPAASPRTDSGRLLLNDAPKPVV
jgi:predicted amidohydrolase YtcJ